jgi:galactose mutarotase-like enzyme
MESGVGLARYRPQRNWGPRIHEVDYVGMRLVVLENERLRLGILAGKGSDVVEFNDKRRDLDFVWLTAGGVRNQTDYLSTSPDLISTFIDTFPGGWQEVFPNGGAPSVAFGAQYGQHGEVCNLPWDVRIDEDTEQAVAVTFSVRTQKSPFRLEKQIRLVSDEPTVHITETVTNESDLALAAMWGHHVAFGRPFLDETCRITLPDDITIVPHPDPIHPLGRRVRADQRPPWPIAEGADGAPVDLSKLPPRGTVSEIVYLTGFTAENAWYEVTHPGKQVRFRLEWDAATMPYLWYWQEYGAEAGYPWYSRHYNIGLEPFSSYPTNGLATAIENGTALPFAPREQRTNWLRATVLDLE